MLRTADGETVDSDVVVAPSTHHARRREGSPSDPWATARRTGSSPGGRRSRHACRSASTGCCRTATSAGRPAMTVYACRPGTLDVTILGKTGDPDPRLRRRLRGRDRSRRRPARRRSTASRRRRTPTARAPCIFDLENPGFAGTTTIVFTPRARAHRTKPFPGVAIGRELAQPGNGSSGSVSASIASRAASSSPAGDEQPDRGVAVLVRVLVDRAFERRRRSPPG